jgi:hypothetical protein
MDLERKKSGIEAIRDFKEYFLKEFGQEVVIVIGNTKNKRSKIDMNSLEKVANDVLDELYPGKFPEGIRKRLRKRELVVVRYCFFKIATEMGYTSTSIALFLGFDHATVLHGNRVITNLIEAMNSQVILNYNLILNELKERSRDDADIQPNQHSEPNA